MTDRAPLSDEVVDHAIREHLRGCDCWQGYFDALCPCGSTVAVCCRCCERPIVIKVVRTPRCHHARELLEEADG